MYTMNIIGDEKNYHLPGITTRLDVSYVAVSITGIPNIYL